METKNLNKASCKNSGSPQSHESRASWLILVKACSKPRVFNCLMQGNRIFNFCRLAEVIHNHITKWIYWSLPLLDDFLTVIPWLMQACVPIHAAWTSRRWFEYSELVINATNDFCYEHTALDESLATVTLHCANPRDPSGPRCAAVRDNTSFFKCSLSWEQNFLFNFNIGHKIDFKLWSDQSKNYWSVEHFTKLCANNVMMKFINLFAAEE